VSDFNNTLLNQNGFAILELTGSYGHFLDFRPGAAQKVPGCGRYPVVTQMAESDGLLAIEKLS
jgi:hypothetical protein